ncbi:DUF6932 family protein [Magnetococcales bacterium HHB-1]
MIPDFNTQGLIPPYISKSKTGDTCSPYKVCIMNLVKRFAPISSKRAYLLQGLLQFRAKLRQCGFLNGYQWIDGSFVENVEYCRERPPKDIDLVTFFCLSQLNAEGLKYSYGEKYNYIRGEYHCDTFWVNLELERADLIELVTFWFGFYSHTRTEQHKGLLQLDLDTVDADQAALAELQHYL